MTWVAVVKRALRNFALSVPVTVAFLDHVGYIARVEGISMQPSLNPSDQEASDFVFLNKWAVRNYDVNHGDIISLTCPRNPDQKLIKRVIAKEGEVVQAANRYRFVKIPSGHCWVEGDHQSHSMDSNFFGPVSLGLVTAKASHIVWPPSRWQRLNSTLPEGRKPLFGGGVPFHASWSEEDDDEAHSDGRYFSN